MNYAIFLSIFLLLVQLYASCAQEGKLKFCIPESETNPECKTYTSVFKPGLVGSKYSIINVKRISTSRLMTKIFRVAHRDEELILEDPMDIDPEMDTVYQSFFVNKPGRYRLQILAPDMANKELASGYFVVESETVKKSSTVDNNNPNEGWEEEWDRDMKQMENEWNKELEVLEAEWDQMVDKEIEKLDKEMDAELDQWEKEMDKFLQE